MAKSYSVAEARSSLPALIDEVQEDRPVEITRRGKPVAVLLSSAEYSRLRSVGQRKKGLWQAIERIRGQPGFAGIEANELDFDSLRDRGAARDFKWEN